MSGELGVYSVLFFSFLLETSFFCMEERRGRLLAALTLIFGSDLMPGDSRERLDSLMEIGSGEVGVGARLVLTSFFFRLRERSIGGRGNSSGVISREEVLGKASCDGMNLFLTGRLACGCVLTSELDREYVVTSALLRTSIELSFMLLSPLPLVSVTLSSSCEPSRDGPLCSMI